MRLSIGIVALASLGILAAAILLATALFLLRAMNIRAEWARRRIAGRILLDPEFVDLASGDQKAFIDSFIELRQSLELDDSKAAAIASRLSARGFEAKLARGLASPLAMRRSWAALVLGYLPTPLALRHLHEALMREGDAPTRLQIAASIARRGDSSSIPFLVDSLRTGSSWYREKLLHLIVDYGEAFYCYYPKIASDSDPWIRRLAIEFAGVYPASDLRELLRRTALSGEEGLALAAAKSLASLYRRVLASDEFLIHPSRGIRAQAFEALGKSPGPRNLERLLNQLRAAGGDIDAKSPTMAAESGILAARALSSMIAAMPELIPAVESAFGASESPGFRDLAAGALSFRVEYFLARLLSRDREPAKELLGEILGRGMHSDTIAFLNRNKDPEVENEILSVIKPLLRRGADSPELGSQRSGAVLERDLRLYASEKALAKLGLSRLVEGKKPRTEKAEPEKTAALAFILTLICLAILSPLVAAIWKAAAVARIASGAMGADAIPGFIAGLESALRDYVVGFNYALAYYSAAVNALSMLLLAVSAFGAAAQARRWRVKKMGFLFRKGMLPSISIIAPAYNESATITESVNSLINLKYPDYELLVVNDGSPDDTLGVLVRAFGLAKVDAPTGGSIATKAVRGVYRNPAIPGLTVIDKANGGKADSLNAGINMARKDYVCGIDADSLLEGEALLKAAAPYLDTEREFLASGGNIMPVNGCSVERGSLECIRIPGNAIAAFQTVEYIRAFMAGRVGWSSLGCLLIISGAFGLFRRERVLEVGGYLSSSGRFAKDTVGEDLELVVRLRQRLLEMRTPHVAHYAFNANCWTEVPESMKILSRQRDRWHRGLLDILFYHRRMMFNPRYGAIGLFAFPYFLVFETIGPLFEALGYALVLVAALLGLVDAALALLLFAATVLMGILVSIASLLIAETGGGRFPKTDLAKLLGFAFLENFGFRQLVSLWRAKSFFGAMRKPKGWGVMTRKGFAKKPA